MRFGVNARESRLRWIVCTGGSSKISVPGGCSTSALMISRTLPLPLMKVSLSFERPFDVVVAAQGVEVVLLVAVERRFLPKPPEHRVRVSR